MSVPAATGVADGVHPELAKLLTSAVWMLRCRTRRRHFATSARVVLLTRGGAPVGDPSVDLLAAADAPPDHALRVDLAVGGLQAVIASWARLALRGVDTSRTRVLHAGAIVVRPGPLEPLESDHSWRRAWHVACGIVGVKAGPVYAATRAGWLDVDQGEPVVVPRLRAVGRPLPG